MAQVGMGGSMESMQEPGMLVGLFNSSDSIVRRSIFGIARFDLTKRTFQFTPIGPSTGGMMGLHVTPDRKTGYTVSFSGNGGHPPSEFWVFDLTTNKLERKPHICGRPPLNFGRS